MTAPEIRQKVKYAVTGTVVFQPFTATDGPCALIGVFFRRRFIGWISTGFNRYEFSNLIIRGRRTCRFININEIDSI